MKGWHGESVRHSLASRGIRTVLEDKNKNKSIRNPYEEPLGSTEKYISEWSVEEDREKWKEFPKDTKQFFMASSDLPMILEMRAKPEYFEEKKGILSDLVLMSSNRYKDLVIEGFDGDQYRAWDGAVNENHLEKLIEIIERGEKFPPLYLKYKDGYFNQEGRHRAELMKRLGVSKVPVIIIRDEETDEDMNIEEMIN